MRPRVWLSRTRRSDKIFYIGRIYRGYVGLMWVNRFFDLAILWPKFKQ